MTADPTHPNLDPILQKVYELYVDYALKNPFYDVEQPIQNACEKFVFHVEELIKSHSTTSTSSNENGV